MLRCPLLQGTKSQSRNLCKFLLYTVHCILSLSYHSTIYRGCLNLPIDGYNRSVEVAPHRGSKQGCHLSSKLYSLHTRNVLIAKICRTDEKSAPFDSSLENNNLRMAQTYKGLRYQPDRGLLLSLLFPNLFPRFCANCIS